MAAPPPSSSSVPFFCNSCLCELTLFNDVPTTGSRIQKRYYTNCQHVLCNNCKIRSKDQCGACKKPCRTIEINEKMNPYYRTYFESLVKMRANLIGAVQFQTIQREHITSRLIAQGRVLQGKTRELKQKLVEMKAECANAKAEQGKISIIFEKICVEIKRHRVEERNRQKQSIAEAQRQQQRAHQFRQSHRPTHRDSSDWFGDDNQNDHQHQRHGHGHGPGLGLGQSNYGHANHGWTGGFDAATTAQTNFGETPQTYRPFIDATPVGPSRQQPNFMDPFQTMNNRY